MQPIVCATRGGQASRRTQERAVALAKERGAPLLFLCTVDPEFTNPASEALRAALSEELRWLGRSLLLIAQARAQAQGVDAQIDILCGVVWPNIADHLKRVNARTLVIGAPRNPAEVFGPADVDQQAESIRQELGIEVIVVR
jgi:nucleotide-binding universal stress UspA family protein